MTTVEPMSDQYATLALLYDLLIPDPPGMLEFYRALAKRTAEGGPILEVGAGTGRLTVELLGDGHAVTAVDLSAPMLRAIGEKAQRRGPRAQALLEVREGDQRTFRLGRRFPLVLSTGGTLQHCLTDEDYRLSLRTLREHVADGQLMALDVAGVPKELERGSYRTDYGVYSLAHITPRWTRVHSWDDCRHDPETKITEVVSSFAMQDAKGADTDRFDYHFRYVYRSPEGLAALVEQTGFRVEALHGGFLGEPPTPHCRDVVLIARAAR